VQRGVLSCLRLHASCHDPQNVLWKRVCYPCAAMQARCCDSQNALVQGRCYPALPCKLAAVVIHRMLCGRRCAIPALPCKLAAVVIHRMLWCKEGLSLRCHACSCCHDPQNALVEEGCYPCAVMQASCCHDPQNALWKKGVTPGPCKLAAV
jgi:hypothetical protein